MEATDLPAVALSQYSISLCVTSKIEGGGLSAIKKYFFEASLSNNKLYIMSGDRGDQFIISIF